MENIPQQYNGAGLTAIITPKYFPKLEVGGLQEEKRRLNDYLSHRKNTGYIVLNKQNKCLAVYGISQLIIQDYAQVRERKGRKIAVEFNRENLIGRVLELDAAMAR